MTFLIWIIISVFVIACLVKPIYGVALFFAIRILIPECARISGSISLNTFLIFVLFLFFVKDLFLNNRPFEDRSLLRNYLGFSFASLICLVFSNYTDISYQFNSIVQFFITNMLIGILAAYYIKNQRDVKIVITVLTYSVFITCIWTVIAFSIKSNPYVDFFNVFFNYRQDKLFDESNLMMRGLYASSGTFVHANGIGYFLPITFAFYFFILKIKYRQVYFILLVLISVSIFLCTKRSAIIALIGFLVAFFVFSSYSIKKVKYILIFLCALVTFVLVVEFVPSLSNLKRFVESSVFFWDDNLASNYGIGGSTFSMRLMQIMYPFVEIKDNLFFGNGFGWTSLYLINNPFHPILFGFETIIAQVVVTMGISGVFLWTWMFWMSYKYCSRYDDQKLYYKLFLYTQLTIAVATGLSYFIFFSLYTVLLSKIYLLKLNK